MEIIINYAKGEKLHVAVHSNLEFRIRFVYKKPSYY